MSLVFSRGGTALPLSARPSCKRSIGWGPRCRAGPRLSLYHGHSTDLAISRQIVCPTAMLGSVYIYIDEATFLILSLTVREISFSLG